jgi:hypothetical protein
MTNETLGWILTLVLIAGSITIRAIYLSVVQKRDERH